MGYRGDTAPLLSDNYLNYVYGADNQPIEQVPFPQITPISVATSEDLATPSSAKSDTLTTSMPTSPKANDQILVSVTEDAGESASIPGYSLLGNYSTGSGVRLEVFDRTATGAESSVAVTF